MKNQDAAGCGGREEPHMKTKVPTTDMVYYAIQTLLVFFLSTFATKVLFQITGLLDQHNELQTNGFLIPCLIVGQYALPLFIQYFFMKRKPEDHFMNGDGRIWLRSGLRYVVPGECFRLIVCLIPIPLSVFGKSFSWAGFILFNRTYLAWFETRSAAVAENLFRYTDFLGYAACHVLMVIPYIALVLAVYCWLWKKRKKELDEMKAEHHQTV